MDTDGLGKLNRSCRAFLGLHLRRVSIAVHRSSHSHRSRSEAIHAQGFLRAGLFPRSGELPVRRPAGLLRRE